MKSMYEILVPTVKPDCVSGKNRYFTTKYHREWDKKVLAITGGLTICHPGRGYWISPEAETFIERMIPVKIYCTRDQLKQIMKITASHYQQQAVMAYKISDEVVIMEVKKQ